VLGLPYRYWFFLALLALITIIVFGCFLLLLFRVIG
jgi:hypothetical protein